VPCPGDRLGFVGRVIRGTVIDQVRAVGADGRVCPAEEVFRCRR
jgi:hypothetical protein